jgi:CBS domain-containing protein
VGDLAAGPPPVAGPQMTVAEGALAMGLSGAEAIALTADGAASGALQAIVTAGDLAPLFGDHPTALLRDIRRAATTRDLAWLVRRSRSLVLEFLAGPASVEWLARFAHMVDVAVVERLLALAGAAAPPGCWCFCGSSGRAESLTMLAPYVAVVLGPDESADRATALHRAVLDGLDACGYLPRTETPFDAAFHVAPLGEWRSRYSIWIADPVLQQTYRARTLFDLRPVLGNRSTWQDLEGAVMSEVTTDFVQLLAHDCLASLPPLTFFQDSVVDSVGEHQSTFQLERSALRPLVDVGRVFGLAARAVMGRSTIERFDGARALLPEHEAIFREAAETFRIVLWQQGRIGIAQGSQGSDLPPSLLSRHDRQALKGSFRSILRLLEFTADRAWLERL